MKNKQEIENGVIWITGYSGSGKTTVSRLLRNELKNLNKNVIIMDGDDLRDIFQGNWGYSREERIELGKIYLKYARYISSQGNIVILSAVAMYDDLTEWGNENIPNFYQVMLNVPAEERKRRDSATKQIFLNKDLNDGIYDGAKYANLVIDNFGGNTPEDSMKEILSSFLQLKPEDTDVGRSSHWKAYYEKNLAPKSPSSFAEYTSERIDHSGKLLEIGCGNGRDSSFFASLGFDTFAIDRSKEAIEFCQSNNPFENASFLHSEAQDLDVDFEDSFDYIYSRFVIHAMTPKEENHMLKAATKLLKKEGKIFIECRSIKDPLSRKGEVISANERIHGHYRRFIIKEELIANLEEHGFKVNNIIETDGVAIYKGDNPVVLRVDATLL